jgi:hypothetical protein
MRNDARPAAEEDGLAIHEVISVKLVRVVGLHLLERNAQAYGRTILGPAGWAWSIGVQQG